MICEREREIQAFEPEEYWSITAHLEGENPPPFSARLARKKGKKISISSGQAAAAVLEEVRQADFVVHQIVKKTVKRNPYPPFITSKLQQDAIRRLRFTSKKTMTVAQQLYEGVDLGQGEYVGLITYMRTDSTRISADAANEALELIRATFGPDYALDKPRFFRNKNKAQDAHEAIRPTSVFYTPEKVAPYLSKDQLALYRLIWQRFVASQMAQALIDQQTINIAAGDYLFSASGSTVRFPGFLALYRSAEEEAGGRAKEGEKDELPELAEGMRLSVQQIEPRQHFTTPPPRYSEASLVKAMEENGIGRPSTYSAILSNIQEKGYVALEKGYFHPSELGCIVSDLLVANFPDIFNVDFTAQMENDLDRVEAAEADAEEVLNSFYQVFESRVAQAAQEMHSVKGVGVPTDLSCPACGRQLHIKVGKNGPFLACEGYPECTYSRNYSRDEKGRIHPIEPSHEAAEGQLCDKCGRQMIVRQGKYGDFLACSGYPECKNTRSINGSGKNAPSTGVRCPQAGCDGELVERKSKRGKTFYGCSRFPDCTYALWDKPLDRACPRCGAPFLVEKTTKKEGVVVKCINPDCGYREA
jgi:DNA topoisomerase-1